MRCECGGKLIVYYCRPEEYNGESYIVRFRKCAKCDLRYKTVERRTASYRKGELRSDSYDG